MNIIILLSGPQGAGKSTYAENICQMNPSAQLVSRDALLMEIYGTVYFDPYCGFPMDIYETMYKKIKDLINERKKHYHCVVIVDCWNGSCRDRTHLIGKFKEHDADKIICWKFITEYSLCKYWYQKREGDKFYSEHNFDMYHRTSENIEKDGFDGVSYVHPLQLQLLFPIILLKNSVN